MLTYMIRLNEHLPDALNSLTDTKAFNQRVG
jgi:hypothetical protein